MMDIEISILRENPYEKNHVHRPAIISIEELDINVRDILSCGIIFRAA